MTAFGGLLREWRGIRRFSQLQLSLEADISARHLSFLESGRASPSRDMVMKLGEALAMPRETVNIAMLAAGFAPAFPQHPLDHDSLAPVYDAIRQMLQNHDPYPGVAIDRSWDIVDANHGAARLFAACGVEGASNMIDALIALGDTEIIENWEEVALLAVARLRAEITQYGGDRTLERFASKIARHPRLSAADRPIDLNQAVIPTTFCIDGRRVALFSTIAGFGAVQDVVAADLKTELMFPLDDDARRFFMQ